MYHFRLKWKILRYAQIGATPTFLSGTPTFSSGTPTFCQMGVLNSCFQNPSESSATRNFSQVNLQPTYSFIDTVCKELSNFPSLIPSKSVETGFLLAKISHYHPSEKGL